MPLPSTSRYRYEADHGRPRRDYIIDSRYSENRPQHSKHPTYSNYPSAINGKLHSDNSHHYGSPNDESAGADRYEYDDRHAAGGDEDEYTREDSYESYDDSTRDDQPPATGHYDGRDDHRYDDGQAPVAGYESDNHAYDSDSYTGRYDNQFDTNADNEQLSDTGGYDSDNRAYENDSYDGQYDDQNDGRPRHEGQHYDYDNLSYDGNSYDGQYANSDYTENDHPESDPYPPALDDRGSFGRHTPSDIGEEQNYIPSYGRDSLPDNGYDFNTGRYTLQDDEDGTPSYV